MILPGQVESHVNKQLKVTYAFVPQNDDHDGQFASLSTHRSGSNIYQCHSIRKGLLYINVVFLKKKTNKQKFWYLKLIPTWTSRVTSLQTALFDIRI